MWKRWVGRSRYYTLDSTKFVASKALNYLVDRSKEWLLRELSSRIQRY